MSHINKHSKVNEYLLHRRPAQELLLEQQVKRIDIQNQKNSRSAQHRHLLKLASYSHARHVRDDNIDKLTRLMGSDGQKCKENSRLSFPTIDIGNRSLQTTNRPCKSVSQNSQDSPDDSRRRSSSSSDVSGKVSSSSHQALPSQKFGKIEANNPKNKLLSRSRAFSVDLLAGPVINKKRRQSAPEVVVTPARMQLVPEFDSGNLCIQQAGHLSPSYSNVSKFFDNEDNQKTVASGEKEDTQSNRKKIQQELKPTSNNEKIRKASLGRKSDGGMSTVDSDEYRPSKTGSSVARSITAVTRALTSRKTSRCTSRRRSSHIPPRTTNPQLIEELEPMRDHR